MPSGNENIWLQYANVFIPIGVSVVGVIIGIFVYKEKVKNLEENMKEVKADLKEIRDKVIACETSLKEREPFTKRKSPVGLTDRGKEFLNNSGGKDFIDNNFAVLKLEIEKSDPKTAYDVQEKSKVVLKNMANTDIFNPLKEFLFKEGLELDDLITVMGIYLRDKFLPEKGFLPEDVDKTDPTKK